MFPFFTKWLNEEKLVQRLAELIHTGKDEEVSVGPVCMCNSYKSTVNVDVLIH